MSEHPNPADLELVALGEGTTEASAHVESCAACADYVGHLTRGAEAFARSRPVEPFIDAVARDARGRAAATMPRTVVPFERMLRTRLVWAVAPLAAAAVILFLLRPSLQETHEGAVATLDRPFNESNDTTFKGGIALAVVRERSGAQDRVVGEVEVRPFDRIRLELALDGARPIAAGVLAEDGTWASLFAPALLDGGTHFSELSVRFDDKPRDGWIVVGDPAAVERARRERTIDTDRAGQHNARERDVRVVRIRAAK